MIKYDFGITYDTLMNNNVPYIDVKIDNVWYFGEEINNLTGRQIKFLFDDLVKVKKGEKEYCTGIGYEVMVITCYGPNDKEYPNSALIEYDYCEKSMVVPFDDIYNLMKDWKNYIEKWEKETGLEKKGL